jgi:hypothetical protein
MMPASAASKLAGFAPAKPRHPYTLAQSLVTHQSFGVPKRSAFCIGSLTADTAGTGHESVAT